MKIKDSVLIKNNVNKNMLNIKLDDTPTIPINKMNKKFS